MPERVIGKDRNERGMILSLTLIMLTLLLLIGAALLDNGLNERTAASSHLLTARAFFAAEAGAQKAYYYLTTSGPGGTPADGSTWRTTGTGYSECVPASLPCSATQDRFTVTVKDGTGADTGNVVIVSTAIVGGRRRTIQMIVSGSGNLGTNAITTTGTVGANGVVNGNVAGRTSGNPGTTVNGSWKSPVSALPKVNLNAVRAKAMAQGYYFKGAVTTSLGVGSVVTMSDRFGHSATLPTNFTTTGNDTTGTVNVIFIDNSSPAANDGGFSLSGNYTLGGFIISMGASQVQTDDSFGGNFTINGVMYTNGDVNVHGGGNAANVVGGVLAAQSVTLNGNHVSISYDPVKMRRAAGASSYPISWTELN